MKQFQKLYLNLIIWAAPLPATLGWWLACLGSTLNETAGHSSIVALHALGRLESEARDAA